MENQLCTARSASLWTPKQNYSGHGCFYVHKITSAPLHTLISRHCSANISSSILRGRILNQMEWVAIWTTLFKKVWKICDNCRGCSLLSVPGKVLALILFYRLQAIIDPQLKEAQSGFRKGRGTVDQLWVVRQVVVRATVYRTPLYLCFVDLTKAYDSVNRQAMTAVLKEYRVPQQLVEIEDLHTGTHCQVRTAGGTSGEFEVNTGLRRGCVLSPLLFNCVMDKILKEATETLSGGLHIQYTTEGGVFLSYQDKTPAAACI